jgi:hypothetical protein
MHCGLISTFWKIKSTCEGNCLKWVCISFFGSCLPFFYWSYFICLKFFVLYSFSGLVSFIRNGSNLARESGASEKPLLKNPILFQSPPGRYFVSVCFRFVFVFVLNLLELEVEVVDCRTLKRWWEWGYRKVCSFYLFTCLSACSLLFCLVYVMFCCVLFFSFFF